MGSWGSEIPSGLKSQGVSMVYCVMDELGNCPIPMVSHRIFALKQAYSLFVSGFASSTLVFLLMPP
jgi:hypothetical protein